MIRVRINLVQHTQCSNMTTMTQRQEGSDSGEAWPPNTPAIQKLKMTFHSRHPHNGWTILKGWENKYIVATKQQRGLHKDKLHQPQNTNSLRDTRDNTTHMVFVSEPAVKLHAKNIEVGTNAKWNQQTGPSHHDKGRSHSPWLLTTKALILLGFSIMHQWLHHYWILAKSLLREAATACLSAGLRTTTTNVESSAYAYSLFSSSSEWNSMRKCLYENTRAWVSHFL